MNGARRSLVINSLLGLLWLSFILLWVLVKQATGIGEALGSLALLVVMIAAYGALLAAWVYHNIRIWRKKGPRLGLRQVSHEITKDSLSRLILPDIDLKTDQEIEVAVVGNQKVFANPALQTTL